MMDATRLDDLRRRRPLLHCVSNLVSANDCANLALAVGASPMMAQAPEEMRDITAASAATVLNTGTPDREKFEVCLLCGAAARALDRPVVLDPVGVGASPWRLRWVRELLHGFHPDILRVNLGEARALLQIGSGEQGVDSPVPAGRAERLACAKRLAEKLGTAVLLSGEEDVVTDGVRSCAVTGGSPLMARVTGTGCMLSVLCGAFAAVEKDACAAAALAAVFWKLCAAEAARSAAGPGSFRPELFDAASSLTATRLARAAEELTVSL
jgi:hydroxyethylthiazole kinase